MPADYDDDLVRKCGGGNKLGEVLNGTMHRLLPPTSLVDKGRFLY